VAAQHDRPVGGLALQRRRGAAESCRAGGVDVRVPGACGGRHEWRWQRGPALAGSEWQHGHDDHLVYERRRSPQQFPDLGNAAFSAWTLGTVGDYNGDGHMDVVWKNNSTGQIVGWALNATQQRTGTHVLATGMAAWWINSGEASTEPPSSGFALIPAGSFEMGDSIAGSEFERPVHAVHVSAFFMGRTEVTFGQWKEVRTWALSNGYTDLLAGRGRGDNHPVHDVSWHDVVKWCNAASEREGLAPVYRTSDGGVYRTGEITPVINYANRGYRLPTEAEWEKAARGGLSGRLFPLGNTISHSEANYHSSNLYFYDVSPTRFYHPDYSVEDWYDPDTWPFTSAVGSFVANGYGLYDMTGNVSEWCNDWLDLDYYKTSPGSDPRGPSSGFYRVYRGGSWHDFADLCRVACRLGDYPSLRIPFYRGFRLARNL
jgi:formylglycine-generating enzyme